MKSFWEMAVIFIFIVAVVWGICAALITTRISDVLMSPAATTNITIGELTIISETANVTVKNFSAEANSKILDLILLAAGE